jgi:DNA-binding response OmpR family regulator
MTVQTSQAYTYVLDEPVRILVTDDDPIQREFATVYLSTPHASVETEDCGEGCLARLLKEKFDVALIDIDMPGIGGFETIRCIREMEAFDDLPIIVVTGREDIDSIDRAFRLGATSFVVKPVNWRLLSYQIRYVMRAGARSARAPRDHQTSQVAA